MFIMISLFTILFILTLLNFELLKRDLIAPPVVFTGMFAVSSFVALLNVKNWNIDYGLSSLLIIVIGCIVFATPSLLCIKKEKIEAVTKRKFIDIDSKFIIIGIALCLIILLLYIRELRSIIQQTGYTGTNYQWYIRNITNYEAEYRFSGMIRFLIKIIDATAYIFGFTFICNWIVLKKKRKKDLLLLIPIIIFIIKTLMTGGRQDIIRLFFAFIIQTYIMNKQQIGWNKVISFRYIRYALAAFATGIPIFYYSLFLAGRSTTRGIFDTLSTYLGGSIQHFDQYMKSPVIKSEFFGNETMTSLLNSLSSLGVINYNNSIHLEFRRLGITSGNVYTFFRRPVQDFGLTGMFLFVFIVGLFFAISYYKLIRGKTSNFNNDLRLLIYSYLFYWVFLASIEQYSFTVLSIFTITNIIIFIVLANIYWRVSIKKSKILVKNEG